MDAEPRAPNSEAHRRSALLPSAEHGKIGCGVQKLQIVEGMFYLRNSDDADTDLYLVLS
jgi:hypothetical protein